MKKMVDPPSGWKYGFPCELPEGMSLKEFLEKKGYPAEDIDFAMCYTRVWYEDTEDSELS